MFVKTDSLGRSEILDNDSSGLDEILGADDVELERLMSKSHRPSAETTFLSHFFSPKQIAKIKAQADAGDKDAKSRYEAILAAKKKYAESSASSSGLDEILGADDSFVGAETHVPKWWNHNGKAASVDQILHEIRDQMGLYFMKKKLRYDTQQAANKKDLDPKTRSRLLNLMMLVDKPVPTSDDVQSIKAMYQTMLKDPLFLNELQLMQDSIRYL